MPVRAPAIRLTRAGVAFEGEALFAGLDLEIAGGRWTCLLGPSGVGKSTVLRLVAGLVPGTSGTTVVADDGTAVAGRVAFMAQQDLLLPWLDARGTVLLGARMRGETPDRRRADALLADLGLAAAAAQRPAALSGGMRQRVALARTLMEDRPFVLMDEPFAAVDAVTRLKLQALAADRLAGRTVLLVTHDPLEALRLGHRVLVMTGRPATLSAPIDPPGPPLRAVDDPAVLALQGELLRRLAAD
ncbi:MAG: ABC transporter ATP-binding protein [Alphaproteobacteria bacterium]|nr:ABC transporter ATP-binding protein [Alphaproteobacteria bacterium]